MRDYKLILYTLNLSIFVVQSVENEMRFTE